MKRFYLLILIFIFSVNLLQCQKEANNWYFGEYAGITFNTPDGVPVALTDGAMRTLGCAVISDSLGQLLFYTNGQAIWNKNHDIMINGTDLKGSYFSSQSSLILKQPGSNNLYFVFTLGLFEETGLNTGIKHPTKLHYSIVNMNSDNGRGRVEGKNNILDVRPIGSITAAYHSNRNDIWIITHEWNSGKYYSYLLTSEGIFDSPVISDVGVKLKNYILRRTSTIQYFGFLKASWNCKEIAFTHTAIPANVYSESSGAAERGLSYLEVLDFDNSSGRLIKRFTIDDTSTFKYFNDVEFSPDGSKLYTSITNYEEYEKERIYQFDLKKSINEEIISNRKVIVDTIGPLCSLLLGPDGKIYTTNSIKYYYLSVINDPDSLGSKCNFIYDAVDLAKRFGQLPNIFMGNLGIRTQPTSNEPVCEGDTLKILSNVRASLNNWTCLWTGPNGFTSNDKNLVFPDARPEMTGWYRINADMNTFHARDSIFVRVNPLPKVKLYPESPVVLCNGESARLYAESIDNSSRYKYSWSSGQKDSAITVARTGTYILKTETTNGCLRHDSVVVVVKDLPRAKIETKGETEFCEGDSIVLKSRYSEAGTGYSWSTGETAMEITVRKSGEYLLTAENEYGCIGSDSITVSVIPSISPVINTSTGKTTLCEGESLTLMAKPTGSGYTYLWSSGETTADIEINQPGTYTVTVSINGKCESSSSIVIKLSPKPVVAIEGSNTLCNGKESALRADKEFSTYLWSTGQTTREIAITKGGSYSVTVTDSSGCSATASIDVKESEVNITGLANIDFGRICSGETAEKEMIIRNLSANAVHIKEIKVNNSVFQVPPINQSIDTQQETKVKLQFIPQQIGVYTDSIFLIIDEPCEKTYSAMITGTAIARTLVYLPDTTVYINDNIKILLKTVLICGNALTDDAQYEAEVRYDATALIPEANQESGVTDNGIISGDRVFSIIGSGEKSISGKALLAKEDKTPLQITSFKWNNGLIETETRNGSLTIKGICRQAIARIKSINGLAVSLAPNPAADESEITVTVEAMGDILISVFSVQGIKIQDMVIKKTEQTATFKLSLDGFSSGVYHVVVRMNGERVSEPFMVIK